MSDREFRQTLAKGQAMLAIRDAQIMANPIKYLKEMEDHCVTLISALDEVDYALSPDFIYDVYESSDFQDPRDIQGEALLRCNKALEVLRKYKR